MMIIKGILKMLSDNQFVEKDFFFFLDLIIVGLVEDFFIS